MDTLPTIIGKAPSELSMDEFKAKLTLERERVRRGLDWFREVKFKPKKKKGAPGLGKLMKEAGLSHAEVLKGIELLKQKQLED